MCSFYWAPSFFFFIIIILWYLQQIEDLTTQRIDRFCGNQNNPLFTTDGNAAIMRFRTDLHSSFPGWSVQASLQGRNNEGVTLLRSLLPTCSVPACCHPYYDIVQQAWLWVLLPSLAPNFILFFSSTLIHYYAFVYEQINIFFKKNPP